MAASGLLCFPAAAQDDAIEENPTMVGGASVAVILAKLGAELEHGVTSGQLSAYARQFESIDRDGDGRHSGTEFIENGRYLTPQARRAIFSAADTDGDGMVTNAEYVLNRIITDEARALLQAMDDDGDGIVDMAEFIARAAGKLSDEVLAGQVFAALDTNRDGKLLIPEFLRVWGTWARTGGKAAGQRLADAKNALEADNGDGSGGKVTRFAELDAFWREVSRSVREGDFEGYAATCHGEGVLVSGSSESSYPLSQALARWKQGFLDTRAGKMKASVDFRFSQRIGDDTTAHETGIFRYATVDPEGRETTDFRHFEALLVRRGGWKILMEYQKSKATEDDWDALE